MSVAYSPNGNLIASGSMDTTIRIWDTFEMASSRPVHIIRAHDDTVASVQFSPDGTVVVSASYDGRIRLWDVGSAHCLATILNPKSDTIPAAYARFSNNGQYILTETLDSTLRFWTYPTLKCVRVYKGHLNVKYCVPFGLFLRGAYVIGASETGEVFIWDVQTQHIKHQWKVHETAIMALAIHESRHLLATTSLDSDNSIKIWSISDGDIVEQDEHVKAVTS